MAAVPGCSGLSAEPPSRRENQIIIQGLRALSLPPGELPQIEIGLENVDASMTMQGLALDSLGGMEFCISLELDHGIVVTPENLATFQTVDQLREHIRAQLS